MNSNNNIIQFPQRRRQESKFKPSQNETKTRYDLEQKKVLVSASLVSIILAVTLMDRILLKESVTPGQTFAGSDRTLASLDGQSAIQSVQRNTDWEKQVAHELAETSNNRSPASLGRTPTAEEKLRFGLFEGKYVMRFHGGKVEQIQFRSDHVEDAPKYLDNRKSFLEQNRSIMWVPFENAILNDKQIFPTKVQETYDLMDPALGTVGHAEFEMDVYGRLLALTISKTNN